MSVPTMATVLLHYFVGNFPPAQWGEGRCLFCIVFFFFFLFQFGFCMMTLNFPCYYLGVAVQCSELTCFCYHADASLCLGLSEFSQIMLQMSALYLRNNVALTRDIS